MYITRTFLVIALIIGTLIFGVFLHYNQGHVDIGIPFLSEETAQPGQPPQTQHDSFIPVKYVKIHKIMLIFFPGAVMLVALVLLFVDFGHQILFKKNSREMHKLKTAMKDAEDANSLMKRGYFDHAIKVLEKGLKKAPNYLRYYILLGDCYRETGDFDKAIQTRQKALQIEPDFGAALLSQVKDLNAQKEHHAAKRLLSEAIDAEKHTISGLLEYRAILMAEHSYDDALKVQKKIIAMFKEPPEEQVDVLTAIYCRMAEIYISQERYSSARRLLKKAIAQNPVFIEAHLLMARVLNETNRRRDALDYLKDVFIENNHEAFPETYFKLLMESDIAEEGKILEDLLQDIKHQPIFQLYLGKYAYTRGYTELARLIMVDMLKAEQPFSDAYAILGKIAEKEEHDLETALELFKKAYMLEQKYQHYYECKFCGQITQEWSSYCEKCERWNEINGNLNSIEVSYRQET